MTPTNELRFVERPNYDRDFPSFTRVLQQKWATYWRDDGSERESEWLDVPIEKEDV